ncbi:hypothetical protein D3C76_1060540 [compost metagenome]
MNPGLANVLVGIGVDLDPSVFLLGAEQCGSQRQTLVKQVPLGTDLVVGGFFRLHVAAQQVAVTVWRAAQRVAFGTFAKHGARWRGGGGIGHVDAAVFGRLPHQAQLAGDELADIFAFGGGGASGVVGLVVGVKVVVAQAHVDQPLRGKLQGVEHVDCTGLAVGGGASIVARDGTAPRIIRVRVAQRGAVVATGGADHAWGAVAVGRPAWHGVGVDGVA